MKKEAAARAVKDAISIAKLRGKITEKDLTDVAEEHAVAVELVKRLYQHQYKKSILDVTFRTEADHLDSCVRLAKQKFYNNKGTYLLDWECLCGQLIHSQTLGQLVYIGGEGVPAGMCHWFVEVKTMRPISLSWSDLRTSCPDFDPNSAADTQE